MSNHLAIATVTATLQRTLQASVQNHVEGARVTTVSPSEVSRGTPETGVNIFMYQVISNPALHNIDATPLRARGTPAKRQAALDLYYMLSFYGNNNELAPQRLLGSVVRTLNDRRTITKAMIRDACNDTTFSFLRESNLAQQVQQVTIMPLDLNLEDLSKTWSVFFQTPYILSVAYKSLVVLVEGDEVYERSLPVRDRRSGGFSPFLARPKVEQVMAEAGKASPILADSTLLIRGQQLKDHRTPHVPKRTDERQRRPEKEYYTQVRICGVDVTPETVTDTEIKLSLTSVLPAKLRAGVQSLQVVHLCESATSGRLGHPQGRRGSESEAAPFVLRPRVMYVSARAIAQTDEDLRDGTVEVRANLIVGAQQRVVLALNEWRSPSTEAARSEEDTLVNYLFDMPYRETDGHSVSIPFQSVKPAEYLVRLLVDGAESQLEIDNDENSPTHEWYIGPKVVIA